MEPLYRKKYNEQRFQSSTIISHVGYFDNLTVSFFSVRTAEWCLPLVHLNRALAMVIQLAQDYASKHRQYSLLPIYVRLVKTDDLFLSPASKFRPDSEGTGSKSEENCYIEVREIIGSVPSVSLPGKDSHIKKDECACRTFQGLKKMLRCLLWHPQKVHSGSFCSTSGAYFHTLQLLVDWYC